VGADTEQEAQSGLVSPLREQRSPNQGILLTSVPNRRGGAPSKEGGRKRIAKKKHKKRERKRLGSTFLSSQKRNQKRF